MKHRRTRSKAKNKQDLTVLELCAGGGGQTLGLESAGFECVAAVEIDEQACDTLELNRPKLNVLRGEEKGDLRKFSAKSFGGVDLVSGGVPCPPFSIAGKQLGREDERDLFPEALRIIREAQPKALMLENVRGFASAKFSDYRDRLQADLRKSGYESGWKLLHASDYGVPQLRPRFILVGIRKDLAGYFRWPVKQEAPLTVGQTLYELMAAGGWKGAASWAARANSIAPTIVGGSKKHGGPDLGPTRAREQWKTLGVNGKSIAAEAPDSDFPEDDMPRLTNRMVARLQSFPDDWEFAGSKTAQYRQIGNAFPCRVAGAIASKIHEAISAIEPEDVRSSEDFFEDRLAVGV